MGSKHFNYFYKVINKANGKFYYGVHRTNNLNDGYMGSGKALLAAIEKYGKESFEKTILRFFKTEQEMFAWERRVVDDALVANRSCYNLQVGGRGVLSVHFKEFWASERGRKVRQYQSEEFRGYNNPDFIASWKDKYDEMVSTFSEMVLYTDLYDKYIERQMPHSIKFKKLLAYAIHIGAVKDIDRETKYREWVAGKRNTVRKTWCVGGNPKKHKFYFEKPFSDWYDILKYVLSDDYSDSMLYNGLVVNSSALWYTSVPYFEYLGVIIPKGHKQVDVRNVLPNSRRRFSKKTIYQINENFNQDYVLVGEQLDEKYAICINGTNVSVGRV